MNDNIVRKLNFSRKLLLWTAACLVIALPIVYGLFNPVPGHADSSSIAIPKWSTISIKPHPVDTQGIMRTKVMLKSNSGFAAEGVSPRSLLQLAYHVQDTQIVGAPDWLGSAKYDISASVDQQTANEMKKLPDNQLAVINQGMLQQLLADQFKLKVHQESQDLPAYLLTIAEGGSKLTKEPDGIHGMMHLGMGELTSKGTPLDLLTSQLSMRLGRPVIDKTGLTGNYAYSLHWTPDADEHARMQQKEMIAPDSSSSDASAPPLLTALQEQLGLTLQPVTTNVQVLVVDHVEKPSQE